MSEADRVKFLADEEKERKRAEKAAANYSYKAPRTRNPKRGSGTAVGREAGDRVKLRQEIS